MPPPPTLSTPRTILRPLAPADAPAIAAYRSDPAIARYQSWDSYSLAQAQSLCAPHPFGQTGQWSQLAITLKPGGPPIGDLGLHFLEANQLEIGFTLAAPHHGRGIATEAIAAILDLAFLSLKLHRITALTDTRNTPAIALLTRLGFRQEAFYIQTTRFKGHLCDELLFAQLPQEWPPNPHANHSHPTP